MLRLRIALTIAVMLAAFSCRQGFGDDAGVETDDSAPSLTHLIRVTEYHLDPSFDASIPPKDLLAKLTDSKASAFIAESQALTLTVVTGVPTRVKFSRTLPFVKTRSSSGSNTTDESIEYSAIGTELDVLLTDFDQSTKVQFQYESSKFDGEALAIGPRPTFEFAVESTHLLTAGKPALCGMLEGSSTTVMTIVLLQ